MRRIIAGMKLSLDGMVAGPDDLPDWVEAWSEDYGLTGQVDACVLGGGMYPGYEAYWTALRDAPGEPVWIAGKPPTPAEIEWAGLTTRLPHYVLSGTLSASAWPNTSFVRGHDDIAALKRRSGGDIYLVGGARTVSGFLDAGLVDELRLIVYPRIAGGGKPLFGTAAPRRGLELRTVEPLGDGRVLMNYGTA